jgi:hypothetical protein
MIVIIAETEITTMTKKYDINKFSKDQLTEEQNSVNRYNYILVGALFISLVATILLLFHNDRVSTLESLQHDEQDEKIATSYREAHQSIENEKATDLELQKTKLELEKERNRRLILEKNVGKHETEIATHSDQIGTLKFEAKKIEDAAKSIIPRRISDKDFNILRSILSTYPGNKHISLGYSQGSSDDTAPLANRISSIFEAAGWTVGHIQIFIYNPLPTGIQINVNSDSLSKENQKATFIFRAFESIGIKLIGNLNDKITLDNMGIIVGTRE